MSDGPPPRSSGTNTSMARSARAGTCRSTASVSTVAPAGMRKVGLPFTVSLRTDAGTIAASRSRTAIDAPPMFIAEWRKVSANTRRARAPAIDVWTIWRSVWLLGVIGGGGGAGAFGAGGAAGAAAGGSTAGRATTAVVHVATQWSADLACPNGVAVTNATSAAVARALRMTCMMPPRSAGLKRPALQPVPPTESHLSLAYDRYTSVLR